MKTALLSPTADLRARRRHRTRDELSAAALELFEDRGYDATSIEAIAERVLLSPRTFYRYFPAKEDVVLWGLPDAVDGLSGLLADLDDLAAADAVEQALMFLAERLEAGPDARRRLALADDEPHLRALVVEQDRRTEEELAASLRRRLSVPPTVADALAVSAVAVYRRAVRRWAGLAGGRRLATLVRQGLAVLRPAIEAADRA